MNNNIAESNSNAQTKLITDFFRGGDVGHFCKCGQTLNRGQLACMPDGNAQPYALTVRRAENAAAWVAVLVNPAKNKIVANYGWRFRDTPCAALRDAAAISADDEYAVRIDLCDDDLVEWGVLVEKVSAELVERGEWLAVRNDKALMNREHPLTKGAFKRVLNVGFEWDLVEFDAHASDAEVTHA